VKILFIFISGCLMFIASNISSWLPGVLMEIKSPNWVIESQAPIFILYGLASSINMLMLKKFVFEKEINSDFSKNKKELRIAKAALVKKEKEVAEHCKKLNKSEKERELLQGQCSKNQSEISNLRLEISTLQISVDGLHGSLLLQIKRHASLKAEQDKGGQQYNDYDNKGDDLANSQYGKML